MEQDKQNNVETIDNQQLSSIIIPLLKGVLYQETHPNHWQAVLNMQSQVRDFVAVLGLELIFDEAEGFVFLQSRDSAEIDIKPALPRLIARRPLPFSVSLLLALLRKKLAEHDASGGEMRLILSRDEIIELIRIFLPENSNEARVIDQVDTHIRRIINLGFLRQLQGQDKMYEVKRIIKTFVDAQWLAEFDLRLSEYLKHFQEQEEDNDNG
ncbi:MAG: DUF4194 domain-containing protein [Desulfobulbaceae bacterium]|jgi:hypothetical protein|nr:DUF4194 domain-containing protein [Desulfobulbaceae bacterium]